MKGIGISTETGAFDFFAHEMPNTIMHREPDYLSYHRGNEWVSIESGESESMAQEFCDDEPHILQSRRQFDSPEYFIVSWRGEELLKEYFLSLQNEVKNCLVDDDRGNILELKDFIALLLLNGDSQIG